METKALICLIKGLDERFSGDSGYIGCYQKLCHSATGTSTFSQTTNLYFTSFY